MKILYYANLHIRGNDAPSVHVLSICKELARRGHTVKLFTFPFDRSLAEGLFGIIPVPDKIGSWYIRRYRSLWRLCGYLAMLLFRPDVIYQRDRADDYLPFSLSRRMHTPLVLEVNGWAPEENNRTKSRAEYEAIVENIRPRYQHASAIISASSGARDLIISTFGISPSRVVHLKNGVDVDRFAPPEPYRLNDPEKLVIGYVFGYIPLFDVKTILQAVARLRDDLPIELRLITNSPTIDAWQEMVRELKLESTVTILQRVPYKQIPQALWAMDICLVVFTSEYLRDHHDLEGALKLWEYWAAQRPVIATDLPGSLSYFHHQQRRYLAVEPENPAALAEAIQRLVHDPGLAQELALNGYNYARNGHSWADVAEKTEQVFREVLKQK
jgi:glycosyltransferase involved in cell wall biosynthesis